MFEYKLNVHLTTGSTTVAIKDAEKIATTNRQSRGIAVFNGVVGLQGVGIKKFNRPGGQV